MLIISVVMSFVWLMVFFVCGYTYMQCEHTFIVLCIVVFTVWVYYVERGVFGEELSGVALYCCFTVWAYLHWVGSAWGGTRWGWSGTFPGLHWWRSSTPSPGTWPLSQGSRGTAQSSPWGPQGRSGWCLPGASSCSCWDLPPEINKFLLSQHLYTNLRLMILH